MKLLDGETFTTLLHEKLLELDAAAQADEALHDDPVELLRQRAALLVARTEGRRWQTGPAVHYQPDVAPAVEVHTLDIHFPAQRKVVVPVPVAQQGVSAKRVRGAPRQGRRNPPPGMP